MAVWGRKSVTMQCQILSSIYYKLNHQTPILLYQYSSFMKRSCLIKRKKSQNIFGQNWAYLLTLQYMPKLRKHSQIKELRDEPENSQPTQQDYSKEQQNNSRSLLNIPLAGRREKYRERTVLASNYETNSNSEPRQVTNNQSSISGQGRKENDLEIDNYLSKFKDDDDYSKDQLQAKQAKKKKQGIRISNKFFADQSFQNQLEELPPEQLELVVERKEARNPEHLLAKVEKKAIGCKNRLDFKNVEQDHRLKQDMKQKLKSITEYEEVRLVIEVPQVFATNKHVDGALFLKNVRTSSKDAVTLEENQEEKEEIIKDRKVFYENLSKRMKIKKAETLTESVLKECFKKSRLDDTDFVCDLNSNSQSERSSRINNVGQRQCSQGQVSKNREAQIKPIASTVEEKSLPQAEQPKVQNIEMVSPQENEKDDEQNRKINSKTEATKQVPSAAIQKPKRAKGRRKRNKFSIKDLIEEEAEDSDQDGNVVKGGDSSQQDDDADLPDLIDDDDLTVCEQDEYNVHRHFIKDMLDAQQRNFQKMRKKMEDQHKKHEAELRARMEAAARRNAAIKNASKQQKVQTPIELSCKLPSEPSDQGSSNMKNLNKLKQLQFELGIAKPVSSQQQSVTQNQTMSNKMADFERLMNFETAQIRKPITTGLKNVEKFKSKPNMKTKPKN